MWIHQIPSQIQFNSGLKSSSKQKMKKMRAIMVYMTLVSLVLRGDGKEFNFARWPTIIDPDSLSLNEDCVGAGCNSLYAQKRSRNLEGTEQMTPTTNALQLTSGALQWICPCETRYGILDLGPENYPRYLAHANCAPKPCHNKFNQCKLVHYKVHVLREREINDANDPSDAQYIEQSILPESLRVKWQLKPMKVAVACVAST